MIGLYCPPLLFEEFEDLVTHFVLPVDQIDLEEHYPTNLIIDATDCRKIEYLIKVLQATQAEWVVLPGIRRPEEHIVLQSEMIQHLREACPKVLIACQWMGQLRLKQWLQDRSDILAIHSSYPRGYFFDKSKIQPREVWYLEFGSLDELRRTQPKGLLTYAPISAALRSVDLASRERRPKHLGIFDWDTKLSSDQLKLAKANLQAIKEALAWDVTG